MYFRRDNMQIIFFSTNQNIIEELTQRHQIKNGISVYDLDSLHEAIQQHKESIVICDYDSVAHDLNMLITSNTLPKNCVVLETAPALSTGKSLILHGVKAYGNSRMLSVHYFQMIQTIKKNNIWTYPELTVALTQTQKKPQLSEDAREIIDTRLTQKEHEAVMLVLEGLTNEAISQELGITLRTVKAHITSIFSKLHVNDRISLVLLLKQ